jgi:hypothetical protein
MRSLLLAAVLTVSAFSHGAENLRINPRLDYNSDSRDGPLITGDHMAEGALAGKPNYIIMYGEG